MMYNTKQVWLFWGSIVLGILVLTLLASSQIVNSDSVMGWEAFKGSAVSGKFNTVIKPKPADISTYDYEFLTWWTPGQYLAPQFIKSTFHLSIGHSILVLNVISILIGLLGFYKIFKHFQFSLAINILSLLLIISSNTLLYRFISYQGGESLSFLVFPWALYWFITVKNKWIRNVLVTIFLIIGFIAKSQMLLALSPAFFLYPLAGHINAFKNKQSLKLGSIVMDLGGVFLATLVAGALVYKFFISRGSNPSDIYGFNPSVLDTLIPLASPVTVVANLYDIIFKVSTSHYWVAALVLAGCCALTLLVFKRQSKSHYGLFVFFYYLAFAALFVLLYYFDSKIDYNARHFKFAGYLFFPLLITVLHKYISLPVLKVATAGIIFFALYNHYRLSKVWFNDTYVTQSNFRLAKKELPLEVYTHLLGMNVTNEILFFSPFEPRWAIDRYNFICVNNADTKIYAGHGLPVLYLEPNSVGWEERVKNKFPGYVVDSYGKVGDYLLVRLK